MTDDVPDQVRRIPERGTAVLLALGAVTVAAATVAGYRWLASDALWVEILLIVGYGSAIAAGNFLAGVLSFTSATRRIARTAGFATAVVVLADIGEHVLRLASEGADGGRVAVAAQACAAITWSLGVPVAVVAAMGVATTLWRALRSASPSPPPVIRPTADEDPELAADPGAGPAVQRAVWRANSRMPGSGDSAGEPSDGAVGICVSGGGIRAAAITFGALDELRDVLTRARWLVAVSGGGYAAGAMQLALQRLPGHPRADQGDGWQSVARPDDVYRCGSSELDHTRRHGRYLADGVREWLKLGVTVLRGFLVNVLTLGLLVVLLGRLVGHLYAWLAPELLAWTEWAPLPGVVWAVGVLSVAWLLLSTLSVLFEPARRRLAAALRDAGSTALAVALLVGLAGIGLPLLAWGLRTPPSEPVVVGSPTVSLVGGYLATLLALGRRAPVREALSRAASRGRAWWRSAGTSSRRLVATAGVYAGLVALLSGFVALFGAALASTGPVTGTAAWAGWLPEWLLTLGLIGVLGLLTAVDQVRWSLHPFYRRRLASAFAVRRLRSDGKVRAQPYDYDTETTALHTYGRRLDGFPELIFSCAAHVSGQEVAPPGRRVVPWILSGAYVGGQTHGWVATGDLHSTVSATLQHDLTVEAAQAISGATLASQMGVRQRVYTKFLTLTNLRLGSWLPNPAYLHQLTAAAGRSWALPRLPARRRLTTLLQELGGAFTTEGPLVYVTDGGHYERLGLVELLRRRPAVVYCVDAGGEQHDVPRSLAQAIELAYEELGIAVHLDDAARLGAGPDQPPSVVPTDQLTAGMIDRLAPACVITGTISYPDLGAAFPPAEGKIVVGKAVLTADTPFPVLAYASDHSEFPCDRASDQWFDACQFDAYHSLGRHIGAVMLKQIPPGGGIERPQPGYPVQSRPPNVAEPARRDVVSPATSGSPA